MLKPKVAITIPKPHFEREFVKEARDILYSFALISRNETEMVFAEDHKSEFIKDADGVITGWGDNGLTKKNIEAAGNLKIIGVIGSSVKLVQPELAMDREITIVNTTSAMGDSVAEFTIGLTIRISLLKRRKRTGLK